MISREGAIHLARQAVEGAVDVPADAPVSVETGDEQIVVEFRTDLPEGVRGPDYHARVTLDAETGDVIDVLGG